MVVESIYYISGEAVSVSIFHLIIRLFEESKTTRKESLKLHVKTLKTVN